MRSQGSRRKRSGQRKKLWELHTVCKCLVFTERHLIMNQTIGHVTREPIPTFLLWSTVISTFFMDVFRIEGGGQKEEEAGR